MRSLPMMIGGTGGNLDNYICKIIKPGPTPFNGLGFSRYRGCNGSCHFLPTNPRNPAPYVVTTAIFIFSAAFINWLRQFHGNPLTTPLSFDINILWPGNAG